MELCRDYMACVEGHKDVSKSQIGESSGRTFKRLPFLDSKEAETQRKEVFPSMRRCFETCYFRY